MQHGTAQKRLGRLALSVAIAATWTGGAVAQDIAKPDLLSFASGAVPVLIESAPSDLRIGVDQAIAMVDGNWGKTGIMRKPATEDDRIEITFALPAETRFDGFFVPNIVETRSPSQTFVRDVEVLGSADGVDGPYVGLARARLEVGEATPLTLSDDRPAVRWVRLRLSGGIDVQTEKSFLEFSEIVGTGTQADVAPSEAFDGVFSGRGVKLELEQTGTAVNGCYDGNSLLTGTVEGNILRALGQNQAGIPSQFILIATEDGALQGLRSTNGAPFKPYNGAPSTKAASCLAPEPPVLGCGSIVHGIGFDFDSAQIRPSSDAILQELYAGLAAETDVDIQIIGHSSSEGAADYNRDLSQRRAQSVVAALTGLGLDAGRVSAVGRGEDEPIASNDDEAGRSLNRRVEIHCAG